MCYFDKNMMSLYILPVFFISSWPQPIIFLVEWTYSTLSDYVISINAWKYVENSLFDKICFSTKGVAEQEPVTRCREGGSCQSLRVFFLDFCMTQCLMPVSHVWSYICLQVIVNLCLISLYMHELWFCAKILNMSKL